MPSTFFERLQRIIAVKKMSQKRLSELLGVDQGTVSRWRKKPPSMANVVKICEEIGCDFNWLANGTGDPFPSVLQGARFAAKALANQGVPIRQVLAEQRSADQPEQDEHFSMTEMVTMTVAVLESKTVYRSALALNIRAFHEAVQGEEEMGKVRDEVAELRKEIRELREDLSVKRTEQAQKRDSQANE